jgi:membrane protein DedA with SNARE-associated domain
MNQKLINTLICQIAWWGSFIYLGYLIKQLTGEVNTQFVVITIIIFGLATFSFLIGYNSNKIKGTWDTEKEEN